MALKKKRKSLIISQKEGKKNSQRTSFQKSSRSKLSRWLVRFIFLCFLGTVIYVFFFSSFLTLGNIEIRGTNLLDKNEIKGKINKQYQGKYLGIIDKKNFFLFQEDLIEKNLKNDYKIIREARLEKKLPNRVTIVIEEKKPSLIICSDVCWIIDEKGVAFSKQEDANFETDNLPVFSGVQGSLVNENEKILKQDYLNFILNLRKEIQEKVGIKLSKEVSTPNIYSGDIRIKTEENWIILVNENIGAEKEVAMLSLVLEKESALENRNELEYIDLRTENRVYYKFKNSKENETSEESQASEGSESKEEKEEAEKIEKSPH